MISEILSSMAEQLVQKREQQILDLLAKHGHTFSNKEEMARFASTRLAIVKHIDDPDRKFLLLDGKCIASWSDEININYEDGKVIATVG